MCRLVRKRNSVLEKMKPQNILLSRYGTLVEMVRADHIAKGAIGKGHDFYHALRVANMCLKISDYDSLIDELAWVAGLIHNVDHLFPANEIGSNLIRYFDATSLCAEYRHIIKLAVERHSGRNHPDDSDVQICLMDADKVVCLEADVIMRAAQFVCHLPTFDPRFVRTDDPSANYRNPKTVIRDLLGVLEWVDLDGWFRLPKALEMAQERAKFIRLFINTFARQLEAANMLSPEFPEELITN